MQKCKSTEQVANTRSKRVEVSEVPEGILIVEGVWVAKGVDL